MWHPKRAYIVACTMDPCCLSFLFFINESEQGQWRLSHPNRPTGAGLVRGKKKKKRFKHVLCFMTVWARLISLSRTKLSPLLRVCSVYVCCLLAYWSRGQSGIFWMGHNYSDIQSSGGVPFLFFASVVSDTVESGTIAILHGSRRRRKRSPMCWKGNLQTLIRDGVVGTWRRASSSLNSQLVVPIRSQSVSLYLVLLLSNSCNALIVCYRQFHHRPAAILYLQLPRPLPWENSAALFTFIIPLPLARLDGNSLLNRVSVVIY